MPKIATNFQVGSAQPIDSRFVVDTVNDLSGLKAYEGLEVYIKELKSKKIYNGSTWEDITYGSGTGGAVNYSVLVGQETVTSGGWQGTPIPNTGYVENVYVNTNLSVDEVNSILDQLTYVSLVESTYMHSILTYDDSKGLGILESNGIRCLCALTDDGLLAIFADGVGTVLGNLESTTVGWQLDQFTSPITFNVEVNNIHSMSGSVSGAENDKLSSLFSITPFVQSSGGEKTTLYQMNADGTLNKDKPIIILTKNDVLDIVNAEYEDGEEGAY